MKKHPFIIDLITNYKSKSPLQLLNHSTTVSTTIPKKNIYANEPNIFPNCSPLSLYNLSLKIPTLRVVAPVVEVAVSQLAPALHRWG